MKTPSAKKRQSSVVEEIDEQPAKQMKYAEPAEVEVIMTVVGTSFISTGGSL